MANFGRIGAPMQRGLQQLGQQGGQYQERLGRDEGGAGYDSGAVMREVMPRNPTSRTLQMDPDMFMQMIMNRQRGKGI